MATALRTSAFASRRLPAREAIVRLEPCTSVNALCIGRVSGVAAVTLASWIGCGPSVAPSGPEGSTSDEGSSGAAGDDDAASASETSASGAVDDGAGMGTSDGGLDPSTGSSGAVGTAPMYESCVGTDECLPGLTCTPIGTLDGADFQVCTAECGDPRLDCDAPPDGWDAVCNGYFHMPPDPFCAIGCDDEGACPPGMVCGDAQPPFTPPFYCLPA